MNGQVGWRSPSNLAIVKYWGKYGDQYPCNPSLSLTLTQAYTETRIIFHRQEKNRGISTSFLLEGKAEINFKQRVDLFIQKVSPLFTHLNDLHLDISTYNNFPHSSGIASSASGMSALALCLCSIEEKISAAHGNEASFYKKALYISRLGSGSACRSVYPYAAIWGESKEIPETHQEYAIPFEHHIHPDFKTFCDDILIVSAMEKSVSSSAGHALMEGNIYAEARYRQAMERINRLTDVMKAGDIIAFGKIAEDEALTLHAMMMASDPSYILMEPGSLSIMKLVRNYRRDTGFPVYFSLDAGPNIHLLYPLDIQKKIDPWITSELLSHCHQNRMIRDRVGKGPNPI